MRTRVIGLVLVIILALLLFLVGRTTTWLSGWSSGWLGVPIVGMGLALLWQTLKPYDAVAQQLTGMLAGRRSVRAGATEAAGGCDGLARQLTNVRLELHELRGESERYRHQYRDLLERMPLAVLSLDAEQRVVYANPQFEALTGLHATDLQRQHWSQILVPDDRSLMALYWQDLLVGGGHRGIRLQRHDGQARWVEVRLCPLGNPRGEAGCLVILQDLTVEKQALDLLHLERRKAMAVLDNVADAVFLADDADFLLYLNQSALRLLGQAAETLVGQPLAVVLRLQDDAGSASVEEQGRGYRLETADGRQVSVRLRLIPVRDEEADAGYRIYLVRPLRGAQEVAQDRLAQDPLTGLASALVFEARLVEALAASRQGTSPSVLALVDLDHFRGINEQGGHGAGDAVLCEVARILASRLRQGDLVARLGADEFGLLLSGCDSQQALPLVEALRAELEQQRLQWNGQEYRMTASIGVTEIGATDQALDGILRRADEGCARAKAQGRNLIRLVPWVA